MDSDALTRFQQMKALVESGGDTNEQRLDFAYGVISQLLDDLAWQRAVTDDQQSCLAALRRELEAARAKLEMLGENGKASRQRIGGVVAAVLGTLVMISQVTGYTAKDLIAPDSPAAGLVCVVDHSDLQELGLVPTGMATTGRLDVKNDSPAQADPPDGSAAATDHVGITDVATAGFQGAGRRSAEAFPKVRSPARSIGPGELVEVGSVEISNETSVTVSAMVTEGAFDSKDPGMVVGPHQDGFASSGGDEDVRVTNNSDQPVKVSITPDHPG